MLVDNKKYEISIFMPVYNGSKYIEKSINSVLNQTYKNFELICVDDTSTDCSYEILKEFSDKDSRVKIYQKPNGGSVPKSWNFALPFLNGDFIMYMSQDDLMSSDNLEKLIKRQGETNADCVLPDMVFYYENGKNETGRFGVYGDRSIILSNREAVVLSLKWRIHGFALWKSKLFDNEKFPEDSFDSDEYMVRKLFYKSNKIAFCKSVFYYRQDNEQAITKSFNLKNYYSILRDYKIFKLLSENNFEAKIVKSKLIELYKDYIKNYRIHFLRKGIKSATEFKIIHQFLNEFYKELTKSSNLLLEKEQGEGTHFKDYVLYGLFYNFSIFKCFMLVRYLKNIVKMKLSDY